jgi:hypothetical protein
MPRVSSFRCCSRSECLPRWPPTDDKEFLPTPRRRRTLRGQQFFSWPNELPQQTELTYSKNEATDALTSVGRRSI